MHVRCPVCHKTAWKHQSNLSKVQSCGCKHRENIWRTRRLHRYRALVERAHAAFATDFHYGEAMAKSAMRIRERGRDKSPTL